MNDDELPERTATNDNSPPSANRVFPTSENEFPATRNDFPEANPARKRAATSVEVEELADAKATK